MIRLIYFLPILIAMFLLRTLVDILGWIVIPPMALYWKNTTKYKVSIVNGRMILVWKYCFMWPWSNDEDGILAGEEYLDKPEWFRIIYWTAKRNPGNNMRFVKYLSCKIDPSKVRYISSPSSDLILQRWYTENFETPFNRNYDRDDLTFWYLCWHGLYSNIRWQFMFRGSIYRLWLGWKIYPHDMNGIPENDYRFHGAGFGRQAKRIWKVGG